MTPTEFRGKSVMSHPVYISNVKVNFPNSGRVNQYLLDFYIDVYSGSLRNTKMLFNGFALDILPSGSNDLYNNFQVGFANFYEGDWSTVTSNIPAFIRIKGYNNQGELKKIALFINYA